MPYASVNDISLYFEVHGATGSPLILIGGYGGDIVGWSPEFVERLAAEHQVILFDNRGVGHSDKPDIPYSMRMFAADTVGILDALGIEQAHLLGASMGGMIAQHVALDHPQRLGSLLLACTAAAGAAGPHNVMPGPKVLLELMKPPSADRAQDIRHTWTLNYTKRFIATHEDFLECLLKTRLHYPAPPAYALKRQLQAISATHDTYSRLPEIRCPVLIQCSSEDRLIPPANSHIIANRIPHAQLIEYQGCAHGFIEEATEQATADILSFLREVEGISHRAEDRQFLPA